MTVKRMTALALVCSLVFVGVGTGYPRPVEVVAPPPIKVAHVVEGQEMMVVAANPIAARVGADILAAGGNAVDAAVATAFTLAVVEPYASGVGGEGFMLVRLADTDRVIALDYRGRAPLTSTPDMFAIDGPGFPGRWSGPTTADEQTRLRRQGAAAITVPGMLAGMATALEKYGTMSLAEVLQPAIELAENGFPASPAFHEFTLWFYDAIRGDPYLSELLLNEEGLPFEPGETIVWSDLAHTLRMIAAEGADVFYRGELADMIVEAIQAGGGIFTSEDLAGFRVILSEPVRGTYRNYEIVSVPPPSSSGSIIHALNILEGFDVSRLGHNSAEMIHLMAETFKLVFAYRAAYFGDPEWVDVPLDRLISKELGEALRAKIDPAKAAPPYVDVPIPIRNPSTTHLSVVDASGNMVAITQSLNWPFGALFAIPGTGILMNNTMADFDPRPERRHSIAPGKRPLSSMSPTFVFDEMGDPYLVLGTPGATRILTTLVQLIVAAVDFREEVSLAAAVAGPRFFADHTGILILETIEITEQVTDRLVEMGHQLRLVDRDLFFGGAHVIQIMTVDGEVRLTGVADPRRAGQAAGH